MESGNAALATLLGLEAVKLYPVKDSIDSVFKASEQLLKVNKISSSDEIKKLVWNKIGNQLLTINTEGTATVRDVATGQAVSMLVNRKEYRITSAEFSNDNRHILLYGQNGTLGLYETASGKRLWDVALGTGKDHRPTIWSAHFLGDEAIVAGVGPNLYFIERKDGTILSEHTTSIEKDNDSEIRKLTLSPEQRYLVTGSSDGQVTIWNTETRQQSQSFRAHKNGIRLITFEPNGKRFLTIPREPREFGLRAYPRLWNIESGFEEVEIQTETPVLSGGFRWNGDLLLGMKDGSIGLWDTNQRVIVHQTQPTGQRITDLIVPPDSDHFFAQIEPSLVAVSQVISQGDQSSIDLLHQFAVGGKLIDIAADPSFNVFAGCSAFEIQFRDLGSKRAVPYLGTTDSRYEQTAFSSDGQWIFLPTSKSLYRIYLVSNRTNGAND